MSNYTVEDMRQRFGALCKALHKRVALSWEDAAAGDWFLEETPRGWCIRQAGVRLAQHPLGGNHYSVYQMCRLLEPMLLLTAIMGGGGRRWPSGITRSDKPG